MCDGRFGVLVFSFIFDLLRFELDFSVRLHGDEGADPLGRRIKRHRPKGAELHKTKSRKRAALNRWPGRPEPMNLKPNACRSMRALEIDDENRECGTHHSSMVTTRNRCSMETPWWAGAGWAKPGLTPAHRRDRGVQGSYGRGPAKRETR
jgi:hypothetical protein